MKKPVLVTGANGFIGQHLVRGLVDAGYPVRAFVRRSDSGNFPDGVRICKGDVRFANTIEKAVSGCGAVFHLAARMGGKDVEDFREVNVHGSALVAKALAKLGDEGRLIFMSSISAMGLHGGQGQARIESDMNPPLKPYGISKLEAEQKLHEVCAHHSVGLDILRPGLVFGPGDRGWMPALINDVAEGRIHRMGPGQNRLGLVYVDHLVAACVALLHQEPSNGVFIAVDPNPPTLDELLETISEVVGRPLPGRRWPAAEARLRGFVYGILSKRSGQPTALTRSRVELLMSDLWFDGSHLREHLGGLDFSSLEECIHQTVSWALNDRG